VFAKRVANGALALSFDRRGRRHAVTYFEARDVGPEVVIWGRRFGVVRAPGA
jgi:YD repeat-containing protein